MAIDKRATTARFDRGGTAVGLGALFAVLVAVSLWASVVAAAARAASRWLGGASVAILVVSGVTSLAGLGLGAVAYAWYRDLDVGVAVPPRDAWAAVLGSILGPGLLAVGVAVAGNVLVDVSLSAMTQRQVAGDAALGVLLRTAVAPAMFVGLGYGLLFCGVVYERVRALVGPGDAVTIAAMLVGFFWLLPVKAVAGLPVSLGSAVELVLSLVFGVAFGMAVGVLYDHDGIGTRLTDLSARHMAVLVVAGVGVAGVATDLTALPRTAGDLLWVAALVVALVGYERSRSVWVPALSLATFQVAILGVIYVEARLGIAGL